MATLDQRLDGALDRFRADIEPFGQEVMRGPGAAFSSVEIVHQE